MVTLKKTVDARYVKIENSDGGISYFPSNSTAYIENEYIRIVRNTVHADKTISIAIIELDGINSVPQFQTNTASNLKNGLDIFFAVEGEIQSTTVINDSEIPSSDLIKFKAFMIDEFGNNIIETWTDLVEDETIEGISEIA